MLHPNPRSDSPESSKKGNDITVAKMNCMDARLKFQLHRMVLQLARAVLADKEYQGAGEICRIIHPNRKAQGSFWSPADVSVDKFISSDTILVEKRSGVNVGCELCWV